MLNLKTPERLAALLRTNVRRMCAVLRRADEFCEELLLLDPRKPDRPRPVVSPRGPLRAWQKLFHSTALIPNLARSPHSHGGVPGRSVLTNVRPHLGSAFVFTADIASFYPTIRRERVAGLFRDLGCSGDVTDLCTRLCTFRHRLEQGLITSPALADQLMRPVEGWWFRRVIKHLEAAGQPTIRGGELEEEVERLRDGFCDDNLPVEKPLPTLTWYDPSTDLREFVKRLRQIGLEDRRVWTAILDFYRASVHRDKWVNETLLHFEELEDYEARLLDEWDRTCTAVMEELARAGLAEKQSLGRRLFLKIDEDAGRFPVFYIRPRCTEACISRGTIHKLADAGRLDWHPDGVEVVRSVGSGGGTT